MPLPRLTTNVLRVLNLLSSAGTEKGFCGADVRKETRLATGTVYPLLLRLEEAGWVTSRWEEIDPAEAKRPRKRFYELTREGREQLNSALADELRGLART